MKNRKSHGRSGQPSLQPLRHTAQGSEEHKEEVDLADAELLIGFSQAAWNQYDAQRNSTTLPTRSEELPKKKTGKEVVVLPVNSSLADQDGEEHVTSMPNSLEVNRDVEIEKQGKGLELTGLVTPPALAIAELQAGASNLHPLLIEDSSEENSESDSEPPSWRHPSSAPEGSLLHTLYLQLSDARSTDGITLRELFKFLKKRPEVLGFESDWKVQVRRHLKTNPQFREAKGYHYLAGNDQREVQQPPNKCSPANIVCTSRRNGASSSKTVVSSQQFTKQATEQTGPTVHAHEGVVRTRREAFQKANAALSEQAKEEFEEMHQSIADMQIMPSPVADPTDSQLVSYGPPWTPSKKRKSSAPHDEELDHRGHPIPGGFEATQTEILARTKEVQAGQRCAFALKDDTGTWRCDNMAMADHALCDRHRGLQRQEDGRTSLSSNPGSPKYLIAFKPLEADVQTEVKCSHSRNSKDGTRSWQCLRRAMEGHRLCERHKRREERKARRRTDAQQGKQGTATTNLQHDEDDSSILGLPGNHPNFDQSSLPLLPKPATISPPISREVAKNVDKLATGVSNHDDDSDQEQLLKNVPESSRHAAARETAASVGLLKSQGVIRAKIIPPRPPPYENRVKAPVNDRDH